MAAQQDLAQGRAAPGHRVRAITIKPEFAHTLPLYPENKGKHIIHSGGKYDSYLQIPVIPPKYRAGDYVYR